MHYRLVTKTNIMKNVNLIIKKTLFFSNEVDYNSLLFRLKNMNLII